jgi:hypothetical protein
MDELFQKLIAAGVRYLLVGGQAMRLLGMPRGADQVLSRRLLMAAPCIAERCQKVAGG